MARSILFIHQNVQGRSWQDIHWHSRNLPCARLLECRFGRD